MTDIYMVEARKADDVVMEYQTEVNGVTHQVAFRRSDMVDESGALTVPGEHMVKLGLDLLTLAAYGNSKNKGFHEESRNFPEELALVHSEVSETLEEHRSGRGFDEHYYSYDINDGENRWESEVREGAGTLGKPEGIPAEIADIIIRLGDICGNEDRPVDISRAVIEKLRYNATRPHKNGKLY